MLSYEPFPTMQLKIVAQKEYNTQEWGYIQEVTDQCGAIYRKYQINMEIYTGSTRSIWSYIQEVPDQFGAKYRKYQINMEL